MPVNDELGKRLKENYENRAKTFLTRRMPVAIRIDGKSFHTFCRGFHKPFDRILMESMQYTMKYLCENIQGCVFGYTQSDEITLILQDYKTLTTDAWFDYQVQKMCSIAASMATMYFNKEFQERVYLWEKYNNVKLSDINSDEWKLHLKYEHSIEKGAMFDARCFNIPKEEVCNLIYWRQIDAVRNSIQMVGQANFSQTQLNGKNQNMIQEMLFTEKGINWNDFPTECKRGVACIRQDVEVDTGVSEDKVIRTKWIIDKEMPTLVGDSRIYVEQFI